MNLSVTGHHVTITASMRGYVESKLERVLRHFDHVIDVHVILTVQKLKQHAEVTLHVRGKDIFVEAESHNMYAALDALIDKLDRVVMKHKGRTYARPHDALKHQELNPL
jgi:putative sigma-54 modulation protein